MAKPVNILGLCLSGAVIMLATTGCGQTGPLYLPAKAKTESTDAAVAPANGGARKDQESKTGTAQRP